jgi:tetratricopeptide (TPR) repeat protein
VTRLASTRAHVALVLGTGLLAYASSFGVPLQFDDPRFLLEPSVANLAAFFSAAGGNASRIVGLFSLAVDGSLHGGALPGYHATNLAIHLGCALLVYFLARLVCRAAAGATGATDDASTAALLAGLLFVAHPIQTEAVTYLVQRFTSLAALLFTGAALAYGNAVLAPSALRRALLFASAMVLGLLALFTKENAVTLPFALAALDLAILPGTARSRIRRLAPFFAVFALAAFALLNAGRGIHIASAEYRVRAAGAPTLSPWVAHLLAQPRALLSYLRLLVWPSGQSVDHDLAVPAGVLSADALLPAAALAVLIGVPAVLAWRARARSPLGRTILFGLGWAAAGVAVECVVPLADPMAEHRVYLPSIGLFVALGSAAVHGRALLSPRGRSVAAACTAVVVLALGAATFARNRVWADRWSLWSDALSKAPARARPYVFLAQDLLERGDASGALAYLNRAAALPAVPPHVWLNMAGAYVKLGDVARAESLYRHALDLDAGPMGAHRGLAHVLVLTGRTDEACEHVTRALAFEPFDPLMLDYDANCRYLRGDVAGAAAAWERLGARAPRDARIFYNLGLARAALGDEVAARAAFSWFLEIAGPDLRDERERARAWLAGRSPR